MDMKYPELTTSRKDPTIWDIWRKTKEGRIDTRNLNVRGTDRASDTYIIAEQQKKGGTVHPIGIIVLEAIEKKYDIWLPDCKRKTLEANGYDLVGNTPEVVRYRETVEKVEDADLVYEDALVEWLHLITGKRPVMKELVEACYFNRSNPSKKYTTIAGLPGFRPGNSPNIYFEQFKYPKTQHLFVEKEEPMSALNILPKFIKYDVFHLSPSNQEVVVKIMDTYMERKGLLLERWDNDRVECFIVFSQEGRGYSQIHGTVIDKDNTETITDHTINICSGTGEAGYIDDDGATTVCNQPLDVPKLKEMIANVLGPLNEWPLLRGNPLPDKFIRELKTLAADVNPDVKTHLEHYRKNIEFLNSFSDEDWALWPEEGMGEGFADPSTATQYHTNFKEVIGLYLPLKPVSTPDLEGVKFCVAEEMVDYDKGPNGERPWPVLLIHTPTLSKEDDPNNDRQYITRTKLSNYYHRKDNDEIVMSTHATPTDARDASAKLEFMFIIESDSRNVLLRHTSIGSNSFGGADHERLFIPPKAGWLYWRFRDFSTAANNDLAKGNSDWVGGVRLDKGFGRPPTGNVNNAPGNYFEDERNAPQIPIGELGDLEWPILEHSNTLWPGQEEIAEEDTIVVGELTVPEPRTPQSITTQEEVDIEDLKKENRNLKAKFEGMKVEIADLKLKTCAETETLRKHTSAILECVNKEQDMLRKKFDALEKWALNLELEVPGNLREPIHPHVNVPDELDITSLPGTL